MGGDIISALKSDPSTKGIPVLLLEGLQDIERAAQEYGADALLRTPIGSRSLAEAIRGLIEKGIEGSS
jgi:response regulator RpfG family c-di-GMP phosphodiesterase